MYILFAPLVGVLITVMNVINSAFAARVGGYLSVLVIHLAGLLAVSLVILVRRDGMKARRAPAYLYAGGFVGVGTVFACNAAFSNLGASLAVALALFGQMAASLVVDSTGFLGRPRYPLSVRNLPGLALCLAGIVVMASGSGGKLGYMAIALVAGVLPLLSFILNSRLAEAKGIWRSARVNFVVGLSTILALLAFVRPDMAEGATALAGLAGLAAGSGEGIGYGLVLILGGGILGVVMNGIMNFIFPKLPALWSTLFMFAGQALAGLAMDALGQGAMDPRTSAGVALVLAGLGANALLGRRKEATAAKA
jgi:transporter family-2 protein